MVKYLVKIMFKGRGHSYPIGKVLEHNQIKDWPNLTQMINSGYLERLIEDTDTEDNIPGKDKIGVALVRRGRKKRDGEKIMTETPGK